MLIAYTEPKLSTLDIISINESSTELILTGVITDIGVGEIMKCGFIINTSPTLEGASRYELNAIPVVEQQFSLQIKNIWPGAIYIAAFAENAAGTAISGFLVKTAGWEGGKINGVRPGAMENIIVGGAAIMMRKIKNIYIGRIDL